MIDFLEVDEIQLLSHRRNIKEKNRLEAGCTVKMLEWEKV